MYSYRPPTPPRPESLKDNSEHSLQEVALKLYQAEISKKGIPRYDDKVVKEDIERAFRVARIFKLVSKESKL